jgi:hypothetical protein
MASQGEHPRKRTKLFQGVTMNAGIVLSRYHPERDNHAYLSYPSASPQLILSKQSYTYSRKLDDDAIADRHP